MRRMEQQVIRFQVSHENMKSKGEFLPLITFALGLLDDSVEINDVLGEGDNITFIVRI